MEFLLISTNPKYFQKKKKDMNIQFQVKAKNDFTGGRTLDLEGVVPTGKCTYTSLLTAY